METHRNLVRDSLLPSDIPSGGAVGEDMSPEQAIQQLFENKETEYQRYVAARAVRAIRESDDEKPCSGTLRQLSRQAGGQQRWRRSWPELLRAVGPPSDPELPDQLQSPLPPHSRWLMNPHDNAIFNVFTCSTNPVEDFYLIPLDDKWRSHRYGVYGLRYQQYPNPGTRAVPRDGAGLYYRPNRKILERSESARPDRRPGVVTLEHVKRVASRAIGQFFPCVHKDQTFFDSWPHIDDVLGCAIEYFHHYFELRRLEETMAQLECHLYDSSQFDGRRRRMEECVSELGQIYSNYLLGAGLKFHHLQHGAGYKSAAASDRQIFEALNAFVAQCIWISYRRPNVTVIARELGRLFRTAGFDPSRHAEPLPLDHMVSTRTLVPSRKSLRSAGRKADKEGDANSKSPLTMSQQRLGASGRRGALGGSMSGATRHQQSEAVSRKSTSASSRRRHTSSSTPESCQPHVSPDVQSASPQVADNKSATCHAKKTLSHISESTPKLQTSIRMDEEAGCSVSNLTDSRMVLGDDTEILEHQVPPTPSTALCEQPPSHSGGGGGGISEEPAADLAPSQAHSIHVSMRKVYGLYTGPPPPQCAIYGLLRNTSPLLRQSLSRRPPEVATSPEQASLRVDRSKVGILGTPLQNYDDVLAAIDYEREEKQSKLKFLGPSSTRAGVSRVSGVVPYLLLPSKFFSPDA